MDRIIATNNEILDVDEIKDAKRYIDSTVNTILEKYSSSTIDLGLLIKNNKKVIEQLRILEDGHFLSETSLGVANVIYILLSIAAYNSSDLLSLISGEQYQNLKADAKKTVALYYKQTESGNWVLPENIDEHAKVQISSICETIDDNFCINTILVVEEPEAHLHPCFIRMIYKDIFLGDNSVIFTTHSPEIASICPLRYYIDIKKDAMIRNVSTIRSGLQIIGAFSNPDCIKLQQYIDVNRADIFFGKKVILVEGISEKILIPHLAEIMGVSLDSQGIVVCNIGSTNFTPFYKLLLYFHIPVVIITDGDPNIEYPSTTGKERMKRLVEATFSSESVATITKWDSAVFEELGVFIGDNTLEYDLLVNLSSDQKIVIDIVNTISMGGDISKKNFTNNYLNGYIEKCFSAIDSAMIGKTMFVQELTNKKFDKSLIPTYISAAINKVIS